MIIVCLDCFTSNRLPPFMCQENFTSNDPWKFILENLKFNNDSAKSSKISSQKFLYEDLLDFDKLENEIQNEEEFVRVLKIIFESTFWEKLNHQLLHHMDEIPNIGKVNSISIDYFYKSL